MGPDRATCITPPRKVGVGACLRSLDKPI